jgi:hypothetical protein
MSDTIFFLINDVIKIMTEIKGTLGSSGHLPGTPQAP